MKLAIPEFNGRVSPVFDCCRRLLVIDTSVEGPNRIASQDWSEVVCVKRSGRLREMGVRILLCGGISTDLAREIEAGGVEVIPWVSGEINEVLDAYLEGRLPDPRFTMPGCRRGQYMRKERGRDGLPRGSGWRGKNVTGPRWR
jgi:predicted Fe-Mo cluster-binding NifX family protein